MEALELSWALPSLYSSSSPIGIKSLYRPIGATVCLFLILLFKTDDLLFCTMLSLLSLFLLKSTFNGLKNDLLLEPGVCFADFYLSELLNAVLRVPKVIDLLYLGYALNLDLEGLLPLKPNFFYSLLALS